LDEARYVCRPHSIQFEILYLLDAAGDRIAAYSASRVAALVAFAELFGHVSYAVHVAQNAAEHGVIDRTASDEIAAEAFLRNRVSLLRFLLSATAKRLREALAPLVLPIAGRW